MIYLDNAATTKIDREVLDYINEKSLSHFGNASSNTHDIGYKSKEYIDISKDKISNILKCKSDELYFTSGSTESINLILKGISEKLNYSGEIIVSPIEHKAVLDCIDYLKNKGIKVSYIKVKPDGSLDLEDLSLKISEKTNLVCAMSINNETGIINDISSIHEICYKQNVPLLVDATQSVGKISTDLINTPCEFMVFSSHKFYGPKGVGITYIKRDFKSKVNPILHGGGHQNGLRSGTLNTFGIFGLFAAYEKYNDVDLITKNYNKVKFLKDKMIENLSKIKNFEINGDISKNYSPFILNFRIRNIDSDALIINLKDKLCIATGSACTSKDVSASHVLSEIYDDKRAYESVRISFSHENTEDEIDYASKLISESISELQNL